MANRFRTFERFFDFYLLEHRSPTSRALHYFGTTVGTLMVLSALVGPVWLAGAGLVFGYGPAWIGHFFFERNKPASFRYPLWSLFGDYRMLGLFLTGRLDAALQKASRANP